MKKILITTAIDYTNDVIHIGHAYQKIVADCLARFYRLLGREVFFLTGTDEHGENIEKQAKKKGISPKSFVDQIVKEDKKQWGSLNLSFDRFIRTSDQDHKETVVNFWRSSFEKGDIYLDRFRGHYCLGCESYKTESELVEGKCPLHPTKKIKTLDEENYFFKLSKYQQFLEDWYEKNPNFVYPKTRYNEAASFLKRGVEDFPISRKKVSWGIPVPNGGSQTIYVWFDALINYYTAGKANGLWNQDTFILHILGKDNLRHHALIWPAMLKSAGLRLPSRIYAHGFINLEGKKISKSLGNIIRPKELVDKFGSDAVRYFFLKYGPSTSDVDISKEKIKGVYNSELANDWGNLVQRVAKLCQQSDFVTPKVKESDVTSDGKTSGVYSGKISEKVQDCLKNLQIPQALEDVSGRIKETNQYINEKEPWDKKGKELDKILKKTVLKIVQIASDLRPFMPSSSQKVLRQFLTERIKTGKPYFPRIE